MTGANKNALRPQLPANYQDILAGQKDFWQYWGFEPWRKNNLAGVFRRQHFLKSGLLGTVAEFYAHDIIIWETGLIEDRKKLWQESAPLPELITQRFLFLAPTPPMPPRRLRSFCLGLKGFLEFFAYSPPQTHHKLINDLVDLVDLAIKSYDKQLFGAKSDTIKN